MKHCIACGKLLPEASLFELTSAPASAQDIPDAASVQQDKGVTLQLRQCSGCGLVQFDCDPVPFYQAGAAYHPVPPPDRDLPSGGENVF